MSLIDNIIEKVVIYLLQNEGVFYASLLSQCKRIEVTGDLKAEIPTAGVTIRNGRIELYWNPDFFNTLTVTEARAVLEHEIIHLCFDHISRKQDRHHHLWNIAADLCVNMHITGLPKDCKDKDCKHEGKCGPVTLDKFPAEWKMPPKAIAEIYYDIIDKHTDKIEIKQMPNGRLQVTIKDGNGKVTGQFDMDAPGQHDKWEEADGGDISREVVKQAVRSAMEQAEKTQGHLPAGLEEHVQELLKPPVIPWQTLLKQFIATTIKAGSKLSWKRLNRRFSDQQKGKLPARKIAITCVIDTSGSIGEQEFQDFIIEMRAIQHVYNGTITVLECDMEVQKEYKLKKHGKVDTNFKGRGGTSFVPPFEYIKEKNIRTDCLVYFTDLCGDFPKSKSPFPVLWVSTTDQESAPFGVVLSMVKHTAARRKK